MHAYLSYATEPWQEHGREDLRRALRDRPPDVDVAAVRAECVELMGGWSAEPLPHTADDVPREVE